MDITLTKIDSAATDNKRHSRRVMAFVRAGLIAAAAITLLVVGLLFSAGQHSQSYSIIPIKPEASAKSQIGILSQPASISIPAISVSAPVVTLGLAPDNTLELPKKANEVGWYTGSAVPGSAGASVLVGHLDWWVTGPAVFYNLHKLKAGDDIIIEKTDGSRAVFKVDSVKRYPQDAFPTNLVYGPTTNPQLRLITCAGKFNFFRQRYSENLIVFASLAAPTAVRG